MYEKNTKNNFKKYFCKPMNSSHHVEGQAEDSGNMFGDFFSRDIYIIGVL